MNRVLAPTAPALLAAAALFVGPSADAGTMVVFDTVLGDINVELFDDEAPLHVANFLDYVESGDYDGSILHRSAPGFVIQGGRYLFDGQDRVEPNLFPEVTSRGNVQNEPGISNTRGTLALAKLGGDPNSGSREWFFNLADNSGGGPSLDTQNGGFTVFGEIVDAAGLAVIDAINALPTFAFEAPFDQGPARNYSESDFENFEPLGGDELVIINSISVIEEMEQPEEPEDPIDDGGITPDDDNPTDPIDPFEPDEPNTEVPDEGTPETPAGDDGGNDPNAVPSPSALAGGLLGLGVLISRRRSA